MSHIYLINVTGTHKPGIVAKLASCMRQDQISILDFSQAVIHDHISLALLLKLPESMEIEPLLKELLLQAHNLNLQIDYTPVNIEQYESWVQAQSKKQYIITLLGRTLTGNHIAGITELLEQQGLDIYFVSRLSARKSTKTPADQSPVSCFEFSIRGNPINLKTMRAQFLNISKTYGVDIVLQENTPYRRHRRLIAFDMDSTLIQTEVIDELAYKAGKGEEVSQITREAMQGELDFKQSLSKRVALLEGLSTTVLDEVAAHMPLTEGAERLISNLKILGYKVAILSGGFDYFGQVLKSKLNLDYLYANVLEMESGCLTGRLKGEIVDGPKKAELLSHLANEENISLEQTIAVGDGANDLPMLDLAGLGIAFHAKPLVRRGAEQAISNVGLDAILYFLGIRDREAIF